MEQPIFYQGQRVVAQINVPKGYIIDMNNKLPIDGKSYYISNPNAYKNIEGRIYVTISGFTENDMFWQGCFIPYDADAKLEEEIFEALKGIKIEN